MHGEVFCSMQASQGGIPNKNYGVLVIPFREKYFLIIIGRVLKLKITAGRLNMVPFGKNQKKNRMLWEGLERRVIR